jgi:hypothetical protein
MNIPEDPVFRTCYYHRLKIKILELVPGTKCSQKIFQKFFRSKNRVFGQVQIPKISFLKGEKVVQYRSFTTTIFRTFFERSNNYFF